MKTKKRLKTPSEKKTENNFKKLIGSIALVNIYSTLNNVIVSVTDSVGNVIFSQSAGMITKGSRKSTLNSVNSVTNIVTETMQKYNISDIKIKIKGIGLGDFVLKKIYSLG
jgi:ribosomal protein S11